MDSINYALIPVWLLVALFAFAGFMHLKGTKNAREAFARWGYPPGFDRVNGALQLLAAVLMAIPSTRLWGLMLGAALMIAAIATVLYRKDYSHAPPGLVILLVVGIAWYLNRAALGV